MRTLTPVEARVGVDSACQRHSHWRDGGNVARCRSSASRARRANSVSTRSVSTWATCRSWPTVRPTFMLIRMCDCSCDSAPGIADSIPTVASSRLCQSRLSRAKMSPNRCVFRYSSMAGANSNRGPVDGATDQPSLVGGAGGKQLVTLGNRTARCAARCVVNAACLASIQDLHQLAERIETARKARIGVDLNQDFLGVADGEACVQPAGSTPH